MGAIQPNATAHNPDNLPMIVGGTYSRVISASLARAWENVLDWEHLPHLHNSSFSAITLEAAGAWGWRARTVGQPASKAPETLIELVVDRDKSHYVSRSLTGGLKGMEIWTRLTGLGDRETQVDVEFHIPNVSDDDAQKLGQHMGKLYKTLWDEDEQMMVERQIALDNKAKTGQHETTQSEAINLGPLDKLMAQVPLCLNLDGKQIKLVNLNGTLTAFRAECPHMLAPLNDVKVDQAGHIICPWHGYSFDITSGQSTNGHNLSLNGNYVIATDDAGNVTLSNLHKKRPHSLSKAITLYGYKSPIGTV